MEMIKAFIGHSFLDEDKVLVRTFTEFFDSLKSLNIPFSWDHAENAEPKVLSSKVLAKMNVANTFVGICTKREYVIKNMKLCKIPLIKQRFIVRASDLELKPSDWILQEIGCAVGHNMHLVLLLEKGLRIPMGLQGDLEYIEFNRTSPERSFPKLLQMIQSLCPSQAILDYSQANNCIISGKNTEVKTKEPTKDQQIERNDTLSEDDYLYELYNSIDAANKSKKDAIKINYNNTYGKDNPEKQIEFNAKGLYYEFSTQKKDVINEIKALLKKYPQNPTLHYILGNIYENLEQYDTASQYFYKSSEYSKTLKSKLDNLSSSIIAQVKGENLDYGEYLDRMLELDSQKQHIDTYHHTLYRIAQITNNDLLFLLSLEAILTDLPLNNSLRFNLAYRYSEINQHEMSYSHYDFLCKQDQENEAYLNNLGVEYSRLNLPGKAIVCYKKAEQLGNTLATSNLAFQYINSGFFEDASELCNNALRIKNYHGNILSALSTINNYQTKENDGEEKIISTIKDKKTTLRYLFHGLAKKTILELSNHYKHPDCELETSINRNSVKFCGKYKKKNILASLSFIYSATPTSETMEEYKVEIQGKIFNHLIEGTYINANINSKEEDLDKNKTEIIMLVSDDLSSIEAYDRHTLKKSFILNVKQQ